ncbi:hypothetical protein DRN69_07820 [Candidatus Pacearchaeota archaeon]|nr:MAG: hypothetical protein DRN69_07820 [Candidatus Pacearchaeota archaeon]
MLNLQKELKSSYPSIVLEVNALDEKDLKKYLMKLEKEITDAGYELQGIFFQDKLYHIHCKRR